MRFPNLLTVPFMFQEIGAVKLASFEALWKLSGLYGGGNR